MTIHVLCLNPAIDKLFEIDGFSAGEDYPGQRPVSRVGGKGVNVARVLSQLGESVHLYAFLGEMGAQAFYREMEPRCACTFIAVPGACRTTVNIIDRANDRETVITEEGPTVSDAHTDALMRSLRENIARGDIVVCSGSIIAGAPADIYAQVSRLCGEAGAHCMLDCNAKTLPASLRGASYALGKPNERELCALLGHPRTQEPEKIARLAQRVMPPYGALLVSMGAQGGVWIGQEGAYLARVPREPVKSTVGSGDASFAGAISAMAHGLAGDEALRLAMACGVANALLGEVGSVRVQDVAHILKRIAVAPIGH